MSGDTALNGAESKDPDDADLPMPLGAFQPQKPIPGGLATIFPAFKDLAQSWGGKTITVHEKVYP